MRSYTHYDEQLQFRGPVGLSAAVATAAQRDRTTMSEFLRRTILARLAEIGVPLQPNAGHASRHSNPEESQAQI
jgi:hypothetical protein